MIKIVFAINSLSVRKKLIISFTGLVMVPVLASLVFSYITVSNIIMDKVSKAELDSIDRTSKRIDRLLDDVKFTLLDISSNPDLIKILRANKERHTGDYRNLKPIEAIQNYNTVNIIFERAPLTILKYNSFMTVLTGEDVDYGNWEGYSNYTASMKSKQWFQNIISKSMGNILWIGMNNVNNMNLLEAAITINLNLDKTENLGVLHIGIPERYIYDIIKSENEQNITFLINSGGEIISHKDKTLLYKSADKFIDIEWLKSVNNEGLHIENQIGKKQVVTYSTISKTGWKVVSVLPYDKMLLPLIKTNTSLIIFNLAFIISFILISLVISNSISKPIIMLSRIMKKVEKGNLKERAEVQYKDEIGDLSGRFNSMLDNICELMELTKEQEKEKREAELEMLQAQINPHFLFNTLSSIRWAAAVDGAKKAEDMVLALSNLLKMSVSKGSSMITIGEEVKNIKNYLDLCKMKQGFSFEFECDMQAEILNIKVPRLLFQPIVENSLVHGFAQMRIGGIIRLSGYTDGKVVTLHFEDNGAGLDPDRINEILNENKKESNSGKLFSSIGIRNINERIKMNYGEEYGIKIESGLKGGTIVTMFIPYLEVN